LINTLIHRRKTYFKITNYDRAKYNLNFGYQHKAGHIQFSCSLRGSAS